MLLTKNEIKAVKKIVFTVVRRTLNIAKMKDVEFDACGIDLHSVLVWVIREERLFTCDNEDMEFNIKLDGRPLGSNYPPALSLRVKDSNRTGRLLFETLYWAVQTRPREAEPRPPKPKSQTRGSKEVAVAEKGGRNETATRMVTRAKLLEPLENRPGPTAQLTEPSPL